jgi:xanthine phosphoribosyltransferase
MTDKTTRLSWSVYATDVNNLAEQLKNSFDVSKVKAIVGVARGGLVPATMLAHKLGIAQVHAVGITSYGDDHKQRELVEYCTPTTQLVRGKGEFVIVVDDLIDSGKTFAKVREWLPQALYVTVYAKQHNVNDVHFYSRVVPLDTWIEFPYE